MRRSSLVPVVLLGVFFLGILWALSGLLERRFSTGTVYPPYSSLRADPLGSKALSESLSRLPGVTAQPNYRKLEKLTGEQGTTLMVLHVPPSALSLGSKLDGKAIRSFAKNGGRVVITIDGQKSFMDRVITSAEERERELRIKRLKGEKDRKEDADEGDGKRKQDVKSAEDAAEKIALRALSMTTVMGLKVKAQDFVITGKGGYVLQPEAGFPLAGSDLPRWYSRTSLVMNASGTTGQWQPLARVNGEVVLAEMKHGLGSVVVATDSFFASNEALWKEPSPAFLAWLAGKDVRTVLFDETHLGTSEDPGIMSLARRFHLHGLFIGGAVLFGLFIWRGTMSLVPARDEDRDTSRAVEGHGAAAGLVSLLKRGVPPAQVLRKGYEAWTRSSQVESVTVKTRMQKVEGMLPPTTSRRAKQGTMVALYRQICDALHPSPRSVTSTRQDKTVEQPRQ